MKAALVLAAAGAAVAQNLSGEPACATSCLVSAIKAAGCGASDMACQCGPTQTVIAASAAPCLIAACTNAADLGVAASVGSALCASFLATASATVTSVTSTGTGGPTSTSTSVVSTTTAPPPTTTTSKTTTAKPTPATTSTTSTATNAAATPVAAGLGAVVALLGAVAAL